MNKKKLGFIVFSLSFIFAHQAVVAQESPWQLTLGLDHNNGDYGGDPVETTISAVPFTITYIADLWKFDASFSQLKIEGAGTVIPGEGLVRGQTQRLTNQAATTESGIGDIWLSASRIMTFVPPELFTLELAGKVKIPSADKDKGLGTGAADYTLQADVYKSIGGAMPFLSVAYKVRGEFEDFDLDNVLAVSVGSDFTLSEKTHVGLALDYQESSYAEGDAVQEVFVYLNQALNKNWAIMLYGYKGLEDGSPDDGIGFQMSYKF